MSKLVAGGSASGEVATDRADHERLVVRRMFRWLAAGCIGLLAGMVLLIINKGFVHEPMFQSIAFLFVIGGLAIATYGALSSMIKGTYLPGSASKSADQIGQNSATKELPAGNAVPISIPSVTERTTELIGRDADRGQI